MRILLDTYTPGEEQLALLKKMGFDVRKIDGQYQGRNYYIETDDPAFVLRHEMIGESQTKRRWTISYHGVDVMTIEKSTFFGGGNSKFHLIEANVDLAIEAGLAMQPLQNQPVMKS